MAQDFEKLNIQWFPGHMTKAQRMIEEHMKQVDAVCEILDARSPDGAAANPDIDRSRRATSPASLCSTVPTSPTRRRRRAGTQPFSDRA